MSELMLIIYIKTLWYPLNGVAAFVCVGTPQGVGPVKVGQKIDAGITGLLDINFNVERREKTKSS